MGASLSKSLEGVTGFTRWGQHIQAPKGGITGVPRWGQHIPEPGGDYRLAQDGANYPKAWGITG